MVYARIDTVYGDYDVDDMGVLLVNWDNGAVSIIESGWWNPYMDGPEASTQLFGETGYARLFGSEPEVTAIHAGLECGLIGERIPGMDMVSFGPEIRGAHAPGERVQIASVERFWRLLRAVLDDLSS